MRLVVLDTNIIISAGIKPGSAPATVVMDWVLDGQLQVVTSPSIVREYCEVVRRPKFQRYGFPPLWLEFLIDESLQLGDPKAWMGDGPDSKDLPFLGLAKQTGAWLVTGNLRHFPPTSRSGVNVLSPAKYLAHLAQD